MNESHQLVTMGISIWTAVPSSQLHFVYFYIQLVPSVRAISTDGIDILETASSIIRTTPTLDVKLVRERVHSVFVSTICKWTKCSPNECACVHGTTLTRIACCTCSTLKMRSDQIISIIIITYLTLYPRNMTVEHKLRVLCKPKTLYTYATRCFNVENLDFGCKTQIESKWISCVRRSRRPAPETSRHRGKVFKQHTE